MDPAAFKKTIYAHYRKHGRKMPWRETTDPYRILISEVMLQQTQVPRVLEKYRHWIRRFPNWNSLADTSAHDVLSAWQGLGYNRRAMYLKKAAAIVASDYKGRLPDNPDLLTALPGIGKATAASICVFAFNRPVVFIETNIRSVFIHFFFRNKRSVHDDAIFPLVEKTLDRKNPREWYWALMDYGTMLKKEHPNPSRKSAHHVKQSKFEGSDRQLRGTIIKALVSSKRLSEAALIEKTGTENRMRIRKLIHQLEKEGLVVIHSGKLMLPSSSSVLH